jgi:RNA polymerase sigma-70 factor, ECF subfamily
MGERPGSEHPQRQGRSIVTPEVDETLKATRTFDFGVEDIVPVARGRAALLDDVIRDAYAMHERELFTFALRATRDREIAADLVQDAYLRLVSELRAGRRPERIRPWLYRVLTNLIVSRSRRRLVVDRWFHSLRPSDRTSPSPEGAAIADETRKDLELAIGQLAPDARVALLLAASGFSGPEIAEQLGRTQLATRTLLCRARLHVRKELERESADA